MASTDDLERLCEMALEKGAKAARPMDARGVVMDPRARLKCMVPVCANYGRNLMCLPNVMPMDQFAEVLRRYSRAILVQFPIPLDQNLMKGFEGKRLEEVYGSSEYHQRLRKSEAEIMDLLGYLEKEALNMGYRFATALTGGPCPLCEECVGQGSGKRCRHPFRSRPSMEAMGIDVLLTAQNAGLSFEVPPKDGPVWNGLLLID